MASDGGDLEEKRSVGNRETCGEGKVAAEPARVLGNGKEG